MDQSTKLALLAELKKRQEAAKAKADVVPFEFSKHCFPKQNEFFRGVGPRFRAACCSRRAGKCREAGTLVKTPTGSRKIEDLRPGDTVYGYNANGTVSECKVTALWDQGIKDVVDLVWNKQIIATSTPDHKWLAHNTYKGKREVKRLKDFNTRDRIAEEYVPIPGGDKVVPEAYAIGALLGDGCSRESGVVISGQDKEIIQIVATQLEGTIKKLHSDNYSWKIATPNPDKLHYYNLWCKGLYAHEKHFNITEIRSWTRKSQLEFLAGLIDTDGSVTSTKDGRLQIRLSMQAKTIIDNVQMLILDLFQCKAQINIDNREKYKNGPVYNLNICNNKFSKRILKELPTVTPRKQWKPEYSQLNERNTNPRYTGFTVSKPRKAQCYDITVDNDTHLFLDANGLIGHNTVGIAADALETLQNENDVLLLYITVTKQAARDIIWADILKIIEDNNLPFKVDNTRLSVTNPENRSKFLIEGAKDRTEIEKHRGKKLRKCYIDEAQSFRSYIEDLVNNIITPALRDHNGELYITGTPGPVKAGYFYKVTHSDFWHNVSWTAFDNPHMHDPPIKDLNDTLTEERTMKGITEQDPSYQRETLGIWIEDLDSLVFKFNTDINVYKTLPSHTDQDVKIKYEYIFGIDIGYDDADAIAVLAYNYETKEVYLVDEYIKTKSNITDLVKEIKRLQEHYKPIKMVMDAGALGKKIQEEILQRHGLKLEAAEKNRKVEFIELLNDDLRTAKFKAFENSMFYEDCMLVQWDKESKIRNPERPKISDSYHSDICDAVLYAWRECRHFLASKTYKEPSIGSNEYMDKLEAAEAERLERQQTDPFYDPLDDILDDDYSDIGW